MQKPTSIPSHQLNVSSHECCKTFQRNEQNADDLDYQTLLMQKLVLKLE